MKKLWLIALGVLFCCSITEAAPVKNSRSKKSDDIRRQKILDNQKKKRSAAVVTAKWHTDFTAALREARRSNKQILLLVTGSDWCPPCMNLEKTILSTAEFKQFAQENIILLFVDSPRRKPIPDDQRAYNRQLARQLRFGNSVPSILLLDSDGKPITRIGGRRDVNTHISAIKDAIK